MEEVENTEALPKILVVDDKPENLLAMGKILKSVDAVVVKADSGEEALRCVIKDRFAVILLDVQMPGIDGFETAQMLRSNNSTSSIPIIFVTAINKEDKHELEGYESGAVDFLYKPINKVILLGKVAVFLELEANRNKLLATSRELRVLSEQHHLLLDNAAEGIVGIDDKGNVTFINSAACQLLMCKKQDLLGDEFLNFFVKNKAADNIKNWSEANKAEPISRQLTNLRLPNQKLLPIEFSASPLIGSTGSLTGGVIVFQDITERKRLEEYLIKMAKYDALTQLANRTLFMEFLEASITRSKITGKKMAVLFLDLDHFKPVNDSLGHDVGDELLKMVAVRLQDGVRSGDLVARLGGDEFAVVLDDMFQSNDVDLITEKLVDNIALPYQIGGREVVIGTSIGVATWPEGGETSMDLVKSADIAMYEMKKAGRNGFKFFTEEMSKDSHNKALMQQALKTDVDNGSFEIFYQPIIELGTGNVVAFEAFSRWNYDDKLHLQSSYFPLLEDMHLVEPFSKWLYEHAMEEISGWRKSASDRARIVLGLNMSLSQCKQKDIQKDIEQMLSCYNVEPDTLELEVSEKILGDVPLQTIEQLKALRKLGVHIALDNFGSGMSSLDYLRRITVDIVKIDPVFIHAIGQDKSIEGILKAITFLGKDMGIFTVAEGVQSQEQLEFIQELGYDRGQGLLLGSSQPLNQVTTSITLPLE